MLGDVNLSDVLLWVSAISLSIAVAGVIAYLVAAGVSGTDEEPATTTRRAVIVTLFTAAGAFITVWSRFEFEREDLLTSLLAGFAIGSVLYGISRFVSGAYIRDVRRNPIAMLIGVFYGALLLWGSLDIDRIGTTSTAIFIAIFTSAALFIGVNRLFDLAPEGWTWFSTIAGGGLTFAVFAILWGNRVIQHPLLWTLVASLLGAGIGYLFGSTTLPQRRLGLSIGGIGALGLLVGANMRTQPIAMEGGAEAPTPIPQLNIGEAIIWVVVAAAIGALIWQLRGRKSGLLQALAPWLATGWFVGALVAPPYNSTSQVNGIVATVVFGILVGLAVGLRPLHTEAERRQIEAGSRKYIFLTPALFFIGASLVVPTIRTAWLSFLDRVGVEAVGFTNYWSVFSDAQILNLDNWTGIFTSNLFLIGSIVIGIGIIAAGVAGQQRDGKSGISLGVVIAMAATVTLVVFTWFKGTIIGSVIEEGALVDQPRRGLYIWVVVIAALALLVGTMISSRAGDSYEFSPGTVSPIGFGLFILAFAAFTALRGTIINNLWWVFTVTIVATSLGLAVAVLADRGRYENVAKSLIFMPMAISFVGAGIIWRFVYIARPPGRDQTGVLNSLWVWLGQVSNSARGSAVAVTILLILAAGLAYLAYRGWKAEANGVMIGSIVLALPLLWMAWKFAGPGLGGFIELETAAGTRIDANPIFVTSEVPFNNLWLMVVLIWIQTGFAMVIFSAAIKAVPTELLEAARVDGATESQSFWRVTIPQIAPTIGVVVTTLIVTVMKVFDIVRVMSAGNFDTNVIANEMYDKAFAEFNTGVGSALAIILFLAILPIMVYNIRRMQKAAV